MEETDKPDEVVKDLDYFKNNYEEEYLNTPISVLRYISELGHQIKDQIKEIEALEKAIIDNADDFLKESGQLHDQINKLTKENEILKNSNN